MEGGGDSGWRMQSILATDQLAWIMAVGQDSKRERGGGGDAGRDRVSVKERDRWIEVQGRQEVINRGGIVFQKHAARNMLPSCRYIQVEKIKREGGKQHRDMDCRDG